MLAQLNTLELRPFGTFIDTQGFKKPTDYQTWVDRSLSNLEYYKANYLALWAVVYLGVGFFSQIYLLVFLGLAVGLGYYLTKIAPEPLVVQNVQLDMQKKYIVSAAFLLLSYTLFGLWGEIFSLTLKALVAVIVHASFRQRLVAQRVIPVVQQAKEQLSQQ